MFAALCDDDKYIIEELKKLLLTYAKENRIIIDIDEFESGEKLLNSENNYDIIVLDFQLGSTDGLTVAKELRKRNVLSCIIFLTSYPHFMIDAFEVNTFRFLLKPIDKSKFVERFPELSLFYRLFSLLDSEMICIFPYFCPCEESAREIREFLFKHCSLLYQEVLRNPALLFLLSERRCSLWY